MNRTIKDLLETGVAGIVMFDLAWCGGISEARRIAALAESARMSLAPHNPQGPVSTAASLGLGFATPSYIICECVHCDVPWRSDIVSEGFTVDGALIESYASLKSLRPIESAERIEVVPRFHEGQTLGDR